MRLTSQRDRSRRAEAAAADGLVNNAGIAGFGSVHEADPADLGSHHVGQRDAGPSSPRKAVLPAMLERGKGAIVNFGSVAGVVGIPTMAAYCAAKGAIVNLTRQMAADYSGKGVRVNAVCPGTVASTGMGQQLLGSDYQPGGPGPTAREISDRPFRHGRGHRRGACSFLLSDQASLRDRGGFRRRRRDDGDMNDAPATPMPIASDQRPTSASVSTTLAAMVKDGDVVAVGGGLLSRADGDPARHPAAQRARPARGRLSARHRHRSALRRRRRLLQRARAMSASSRTSASRRIIGGPAKPAKSSVDDSCCYTVVQQLRAAVMGLSLHADSLGARHRISVRSIPNTAR